MQRYATATRVSDIEFLEANQHAEQAHMVVNAKTKNLYSKITITTKTTKFYSAASVTWKKDTDIRSISFSSS